MNWEDFIRGIRDDAGALVKNELIDLVCSTTTDEEEFIRKSGEKMQRYLQQLADGEITKDEFTGYMIDLRDLMKMQALKASVAAKARAQRIVDGISKLILDRLISIL